MGDFIMKMIGWIFTLVVVVPLLLVGKLLELIFGSRE